LKAIVRDEFGGNAIQVGEVEGHESLFGDVVIDWRFMF